ncbi:uncharacterized protein LOC128162807 [Crassostrea angulata]|uniref:uncharacterized protein LOC128162807 n=1 Tax=Magallana angulata TaxID=2784310 RepID=UPI0022B1122E|nr:uncharacterized protein LOC128162807 [Crassostrea angulata]
MNGSVRESLKTLPKIIAGFLSINNSGQEYITFTLKDCIKSQDCRVYTMLDKKKENTMTLCIVVNETNNCFVSTCTCPNSRTRRGVSSHLLTPNPSSVPQEATCKLELILSENISDNLHGNMTNLRDDRSENPMDCTTHQFETKLNTLQNISKQSKLTADGNNNWVYILFIGFGVGAFIGSLVTFLWFKRKASMPKTLSVVNAVYKSEICGDENLYLQNFTEYSEIPDCMIKISSEEQKDPLHEARGSPKHDTQTKCNAPPTLVVHDHTFEQSFQKEDKDRREQTNDKGLAKIQGLVSSRSSVNSDIQQEKECYINNGIEKDTYEIPSNRTDVTYSPDTCKDYPREKNDEDLSTKDEEDKTVEKDKVRMENLNSNATYFVLSADGNKTILH